MERMENVKSHKPWYQTEDTKAAIKKLAIEDEDKE
ncbi:hypothetical protein SDC9_72011 [bioreactor metagenome]|uniref:Uncharacterized protein n=1 Tax=bioreactor metagenome TaxID=1076179 RepID=A0A644YAC7_9ZZZZ